MENEAALSRFPEVVSHRMARDNAMLQKAATAPANQRDFLWEEETS